MTSSVFAWLDYDEGDRRRMTEVINLFREKGTLDELGIGTIRDTFADLFFPGTSTVQTRARYFLFVPWLFSDLESKRVPSDRAAKRAREQHGQLVRSLQAGGEGSNAGLIGIEAGENIQRLPSSIYWQWLGRWGIRLFAGSPERFYASLDIFYRAERAAKSSEGGEIIDAARRNWHASLPPPPTNLLDQTTFNMTANEAEFLCERIRRSSGSSLLAACLNPSVTRKRQARAPWELGGLDSLPMNLRQDVDHAQRYSLAMEGATLLYNRMLAELACKQVGTGDLAGVDRYGSELARWADEIVGGATELRLWQLSDFWNRLHLENSRIPVGAIRFSQDWITLAISAPQSICDSSSARLLISNREHRLKGALARLHNPRALERWSGGSGVGRLTYRWGSAQRILLDILDGLLQRPGGR